MAKNQVYHTRTKQTHKRIRKYTEETEHKLQEKKKNKTNWWHRFGFEWVQIQILCLDKLKELNLDLAQIHLGFGGLKSSHKPKNLEIPHLTLALYSQYFIGSSNCHALSSSICSTSFSLSCSKVCLSTLLYLFILSISLSTKSES